MNAPRRNLRFLELNITLGEDPVSGFVTWWRYEIHQYTYHRYHIHPLRSTLSARTSRDFPGDEESQFGAMLEQALEEFERFARELKDDWPIPEATRFRNNWS